MHSLKSLKDFTGRFRSQIRVQFNWKRFLAEGWQTTETLLTSTSDLEGCVLPWYLGLNGEETAYDRLGARPLRLLEISERLESLDRARQACIWKYIQLYTQEKKPFTLAVPAYSLPNGDFLPQ